MGRHCGGSRSGGHHSSSHHSSHRSSSRSGSSGNRSVVTSSKAFKGGYNRSYYDRNGRYHACYTSDSTLGMEPGWNASTFIALGFVVVMFLSIFLPILFEAITFGHRVYGNYERIAIYDEVDILSQTEKRKVIGIFDEVYVKSGMPVTLYVTDWSWKDNYDTLEIYSEELYYQMGSDEDAAIIVFTIDTDAVDFVDWQYDVYCGDDTIACFSDVAFDKFLTKFQKGMANQNLAEALDYAWHSVMNDLAVNKFNFAYLPILLIITLIFGSIIISFAGDAIKRHTVYKFYKHNPSKLEKNPVSVYSECPNCGASNAFEKEICPYCNSLLKM